MLPVLNRLIALLRRPLDAQPTCARCTHWQAHHKPADEALVGWCWRFPPAAAEPVHAGMGKRKPRVGLPVVTAHNWGCGEHRHGPQRPAVHPDRIEPSEK